VLFHPHPKNTGGTKGALRRLVSDSCSTFGFAFVSNSTTIIEFDVTNVDGSQWRYDYAITNDSLSIHR
jgi:hypothetical protein